MMQGSEHLELGMWTVWPVVRVLRTNLLGLTLQITSRSASYFNEMFSEWSTLNVQIVEILCYHWLNLTMLAPRSMS